ncbi:hypothetical protein HY227_00965 [Candidatus Wolfebacteria bacterium]|nr:hypothetical protein [Candidatus Wolfebacteria bacterium]
MVFQNWTEVTYQSLLNLWAGVIGFIPSLVGALIVFIIGLILASAFRLLIERLIEAVRLDALLKKIGLDVYFERAGLRLNSGRFFGLMVYWFLVVVFVLAASDILRLWGISLFLRDVIAYLPNVIIAVLIMLAAVIIGNFLRALVRASVIASKLHASKFLGTLTWWVVIVFGLLTALIQLGVATTIINTLITGIIAMLALAGGLAFGLGGKDFAARLLDKFREDVGVK